MNNDNFVWTDELILEFVRWTTTSSPTFQSRYADIEQFKQSKTIPKKEKEYEILTMVNDKLGVHEYDWQCKMSMDGCKIHSIKRLSDGEIISIGSNGFSYGKPCKILSIQITPNDCLYCNVKFYNGNEQQNVNLLSLDKIEDKADILTKTPLGLMPMQIWREQRLDDINNAINRYIKADMIIPSEWICERETLISWTKN